MTGLNYDLALFSDDLLPSRGLARREDPQTSQEAAQAISGLCEREILAAFRSQYQAYPSLGVDYGLTADDVCDWLPTRNEGTVKSTLSRVQKAKLVRDSGERRLSRCGCKQIVWILSTERAEG